MLRRGRVPVLDLNLEKAVQETCLRAAAEGLLRSAHDCADGGLAVALAESCFSSLNRASVGADVQLTGTLPPVVQLFSESPSRIVVSFDPAAEARLAEIAAELSCPFTVIGHVGGTQLRISVGDTTVVARAINELENVWRNALGRQLQTETMAAAAE
jgi:phosphoribosylformylglycinamidine synthase